MNIEVIIGSFKRHFPHIYILAVGKLGCLCSISVRNSIGHLNRSAAKINDPNSVGILLPQIAEKIVDSDLKNVMSVE